MSSPRSEGTATDPVLTLESEVGEGQSTIPQKRRQSTDSSDDATLLHREGAHRAYLARTAPHLFDRAGSSSFPSNASSTSPPSTLHLHEGHSIGSRSPSSSARPSPAGSDDEGLAGSGPGSSDRGASIGPGGTSAASDNKSRHMVLKGFRGPLPRSTDAEEIAPSPLLLQVSGSDLFNTINHPFTRNGYNYIAAGPASESLPTSIYKTLDTGPRGIHWSWFDRSPFTTISQDATIVCTDRGFRSARGNVPVREGAWYVEIHILEPEVSVNNMRDGPHVRLGWGRREAGLNAPVGINGYSYGMRDTSGEKIFLSRTYQYGKPFGPGDVIGMYIHLPKARKVNSKDPLDPARISRKRIPIRYKGQVYFEALEYQMTKEMENLMARSRRGEKLKEGHAADEYVNPVSGLLVQPHLEDNIPLAGKKKRKAAPGPAAPPSSQGLTKNLRPLPTLGPASQIGFFVNGEAQGIAFENLLDFRPLRKNKASRSKETSQNVLQTNPSSLGLSEEGFNADSSVITTTSSLASILKSRENIFDDGSLGYFPFVSLFGGGKVKIVSHQEDFRFPPPKDVRSALEEADRRQGRLKAERQAGPLGEEMPCRALGERYEEYLHELWKHDLQDEEKARLAYELFLADAEDSDNEEEEGGVGRAGQRSVPSKASGNQKKSSKKKQGASHHLASSRTTSTPLRDEINHSTPGENGSNDSDMEMEMAIKKDEAEHPQEPIVKQEAEEEEEDEGGEQLGGQDQMQAASIAHQEGDTKTQEFSMMEIDSPAVEEA